MLNNWRQLVQGVERRVPLPDGKLVPYINFDNAATTPPLKSVMQKINEFGLWYSSIHRGKGYKSRLSSNLYEEAREKILNFVNGNSETHTVIFVKNTTEAINKLANRLSTNNNDSTKNIIISSEMEHHSNDLPWRDKFKVEYIKVNKNGELKLDDLEAKLIKFQDRVKLVTITGASNVTGYLNPISQIAGLVHNYNAELLVDGAQLIPHHSFNMQGNAEIEKVDYLAFSAHKMYAPFGTGVLIGPKEKFLKSGPDYSGGGTIEMVTPNFIRWADPPHRDEAGTPNLMGVIALCEAIEQLNKIGMHNLAKTEKELTEYTLRKLHKIPKVKLYGNKQNANNRVGIIPFAISNLTHEEVASILANKFGIAVRNGCFCAQPYIQKLLNISPAMLKERINNSELSHPGLIRASFGIYNQYQEVDKFIAALKQI